MFIIISGDELGGLIVVANGSSGVVSFGGNGGRIWKEFRGSREC